MHRKTTIFLLSTIALLAPLIAMANPLVIAHRGASAYLPEHTLDAYLLAHGQGADFIEPDLVMTADDALIALHDLTLDATTDVAERFPDRARPDGRFYAIDFKLSEIRQLRVLERQEPDTGVRRYPDRWRSNIRPFQIVEFEELVLWLKELNRTTGRSVGLYPETKFPAFHAKHGKDIAATLTEVLVEHDLPNASMPVFIQSFEPEALRIIRSRYAQRFALIQLIGSNDWNMNHLDYAAMTTPTGLMSVATYADGIGTPFELLVQNSLDGTVEASALLRNARSANLQIHPFTFRREGLPLNISLENLLQIFFHQLQIDGVFTDNPDIAVQERRKSPEALAD